MAVLRFLAWDFKRGLGFYLPEDATESDIDRANRGTRNIINLLNGAATGSIPDALMVSA